MLKRFKREQKITNLRLSKEQFLEEHNKLAPENLLATASMLSLFKEEKASLFKDDSWPMDKLRRPFILWLTSLSSKEKSRLERNSLIKDI